MLGEILIKMRIGNNWRITSFPLELYTKPSWAFFQHILKCKFIIFKTYDYLCVIASKTFFNIKHTLSNKLSAIYKWFSVIELSFTSSYTICLAMARDMWKIFSLIPSEKPLTVGENCHKLSVYFSIFEW